MGVGPVIFTFQPLLKYTLAVLDLRFIVTGRASFWSFNLPLALMKQQVIVTADKRLTGLNKRAI